MQSWAEGLLAATENPLGSNPNLLRLGAQQSHEPLSGLVCLKCGQCSHGTELLILLNFNIQKKKEKISICSSWLC